VRGDYRAACPTVELAREFEKPNPQGLKRILSTYSMDPSEVLVIGDSVKKDIAVAQALGCHDVWAEYGTYVSLEYRERLDIISSNAITRRHAANVFEGGQQSISPTHTVSNYGQVLGLIDRLG
jgi:phosphoglycolate phosphatase